MQQPPPSSISSDFVPPQHKYLTAQTFTSPFFADHEQETYQIQQAFQANNFTYLRKNIPDQIKRGAILEERKRKVEQMTGIEAENRSKPLQQKEDERNQRIKKKKMQQIGTLGYFEVFPYEPSQYDIIDRLKSRERLQSKQKQRDISDIQFRPAGFDKKFKYEDAFAYVDRREGTPLDGHSSLFPFHLPEDTYDQFRQCEKRIKIIEDSYKIAGEFIPSQQEKSLTKITRSKSKEIIQQLELYVRKYFKDLAFFLGMDKRDHIDFLFEKKEADNTKLTTLMSRICENEFLSHFMLRRNAERWGRVDESGYLVYGLLPPWVREIEESLKK